MSAEDRERAGGRPAPESRSVLVVEDNRPNRILMHALLTGLGCACELASSGLEALEMAERRSFDLILMDIHMPHMDGVETLRRLRRGGGPNAATPVVALTADAAEQDHAAFRDAGAASVLVKPISPSRLAAAINGCVRPRQDAEKPGPAAA